MPIEAQRRQQRKEEVQLLEVGRQEVVPRRDIVGAVGETGLVGHHCRTETSCTTLVYKRNLITIYAQVTKPQNVVFSLSCLQSVANRGSVAD